MLVRIVLGRDTQGVNVEVVDPPEAIGRRTISSHLHTSFFVAAQQVVGAVNLAGKISSISIIVGEED